MMLKIARSVWREPKITSRLAQAAPCANHQNTSTSRTVPCWLQATTHTFGVIEAFWRILGGMLVVTCLVWAQDNNERISLPLTPAQDSVRPTVREARNAIFNVRGRFSMIAPSDESGAPPPHTILTFENQPELPYAKADTIVFGTITHVQPFFTADGKGIYTEYSLKVVETVKNTAAASVLTDDSITLLRQGGAVKLTDGHVVRHRISNDVTPVIGQQYLVFLKHQVQLEAFYYLKIWLVQGGTLSAIFPDDLARERSGQSQYSGKPLREVLAALGKLVNQ